MKTKYAIAVLRSAPTDGSGTFTAIVSTFGGEPDAQGDIIAEGAFDKTIREWSQKHDFPTLWYMHGYHDPANAIGKLTDMHVEGSKFLISGKLDLMNERAMVVYEAMLTGKLNEFSIGYAVRHQHEDGKGANVLTDIELLEVSVVFAGANRHTQLLSVKSGARNSAADLAVELGANCSGVTSSDDGGKYLPERVAALQADIETRLKLSKLERSLTIEGRVEDLARDTDREQQLRDLEAEQKATAKLRERIDAETRRQVFGEPKRVIVTRTLDTHEAITSADSPRRA